MDSSQVFFLLFLQNVLNFFSLYFFINKYSRIVNDINIHFEKTTRLFLDHLSDMYEYSWDYWRSSRYGDEEESDDEDDSEEYDEECEEDECEEYDEECGDECGDDCVDDCVDEVVQEDNQSCEATSSVNTTCVEEEETFAQNCN